MPWPNYDVASGRSRGPWLIPDVTSPAYGIPGPHGQKDVGADPTGASDSSKIFQNVVTVNEASGGGPILVPPGTYLLNTALTGIVNSTFLVYAATFTGAGASSVTPQTNFSAGGALVASSITVPPPGGPYVTPPHGRAGGSYVVGDPYVGVIGSGADPTGATSSITAFRAAVAQCVSQGYGAIGMEPGTYLLDAVDGNGLMVALSKGLTFFPIVPGTVTIKVASGAPNWYGVFGSYSNAVDLSGLYFAPGIVFDGNSAGNVINAGNVGTLATLPRYAIVTLKGSRMGVDKCRFTGWDAMNCVVFNSSAAGGTDCLVTRCIFDNIGGTTYHDHSTIYLDCVRPQAWGNTFVGISTPSSNAICALEVHGGGQDVHDNIVDYYKTGGNLVSTVASPGLTGSDTYDWHDNQFRHVSIGITLWPLVDSTSIDIHDNQVLIDIDQWNTLVVAQGFTNNGIDNASTQVGAFNRLRIVGNEITYLAHSNAGSSGDKGIYLNRTLATTQDARDGDIEIEDNRISNCPRAAIYILNFAIDRLSVNRNKFHNNGTAAGAATVDQTCLTIITLDVTKTITDLSFDGNEIVDDQGTHSLFAALNIPSTFNPVITNGQALRNKMRIADGVAVPMVNSASPVLIQGLQTPYTAPTGAAIVGSTIQEITTGLVYTQLATPNGTAWAAVAPADATGFSIVRVPWAPQWNAFITIGGANRAVYYRVISGGTISKVRIHVSVQSGNISVAAYRSAGAGLAATPTTRLATSGAIACPAPGVSDVSLGASVTLNPGDWLCLTADNATATFGGIAGAGTSTISSGEAYFQSTAHPAPTTPASLTADNTNMVTLIGVP